MKKVVLQFRDLNALWSFTRNVKLQDFKVNSEKKQIRLNYDEGIIIEALGKYNAKIVSDLL